jgi:hypothetical protein
MLGIIVILIVVITSVWIYLDATKNKIGEIANDKSMFNLSAGGWVAGALLLWIVVFPAYLIKRKSLIEKAKGFPIEVKGRILKTVLLASIGFVIIILIAVPSYISYIKGNLPACDSPEVVSLAEKVIKNSPVIKLLGLQIKSISIPAERSYDPDTEKRICRAILSSSVGDEAIQYSVEWHNKDKNMIWVEIIQ